MSFILQIRNNKKAAANLKTLRELREEKNLSVLALADKLKIEDSTIYRWETGETSPRLETYRRLKEILGEDFVTTRQGAI